MPGSVRIRQDFSSEDLRRLGSRSKDAKQSRRLLSLAAVLDGMNRADAARIGGMDRQTLRDWVHRFNEAGPEGCSTTGRPAPRHDYRKSKKPNSSLSLRPAPTRQ
jgi:hypothetical protein